MAANNDGSIYVQVRHGDGEVTLQGESPDIVKVTRETLEKVSALVETACAGLVARIRQMDAKPSEIGVEFGVNVGGEAGIPFVSKGTAGAEFKVSVSWKS